MNCKKHFLNLHSKVIKKVIIFRQKQNDLFHAKIQTKEKNLLKLQSEYQKLNAYKAEKVSIDAQRPPETQEEERNRKVC